MLTYQSPPSLEDVSELLRDLRVLGLMVQTRVPSDEPGALPVWEPAAFRVVALNVGSLEVVLAASGVIAAWKGMAGLVSLLETIRDWEPNKRKAIAEAIKLEADAEQARIRLKALEEQMFALREPIAPAVAAAASDNLGADQDVRVASIGNNPRYLPEVAVRRAIIRIETVEEIELP